MKNIRFHSTKGGFTLIELLIVVAIMSVLAIVTLVALKPAQRLADARDARRAQDVNQILTAIHQCSIDKKDTSNMATCLGTNTVSKTYEIVSGAVTTGCNTLCTGVAASGDCLPLDTTLSDYFTSLPKDPNIATVGHTGYALTRYANGMVVLDVCGAENGPIKVSQ
jgi:prepilin-type N-terminal cleavage/methylation domain-containing protein